VPLDEQANLVVRAEVDRPEEVLPSLAAQGVLRRVEQRSRRLPVPGTLEEPEEAGAGGPTARELFVDDGGDAADDDVPAAGEEAPAPAPAEGGVVRRRPAAALLGAQRRDPARVGLVKVIG